MVSFFLWNEWFSCLNESKRAWPSFEALHMPGMFLIGWFNSISHIKESLSAKIWPLIFFFFFFYTSFVLIKTFFFCYFKFLESWLNFLCLVINELKNEFKNAFLCIVIFVVQFKTIIASILCKAITCRVYKHRNKFYKNLTIFLIIQNNYLITFFFFF